MNRKIQKLVLLFFTIVICLFTSNVFAGSDIFPKIIPAPTITIPSSNNIYYCSPSGDNNTGNGSISNPWLDLIGANSGGTGSPVSLGALIYLRGGRYPSYSIVNFSRSQNILSRSGSSTNPIVITNYPGEIAEWNSVNTIWSLTLDGSYQKLIGTKVGSSYGIKVIGGISIRGDNCQVSGVEFIGGTSNGGDGNPAMLSQPLRTYYSDILVSHNYFHDSAFQISGHRMVCVRFFSTTNAVLEYNIFEDNSELYQGGCIYFKDMTNNATIRYNKFMNSAGGISYSVQGNHFEGLEVYGNLSYNCKWFICFINDLGNSEEINIFNNVVLDLTSAFMYYLNADNQTWSEHGNIYNNVIDGLAFEKGWHSYSSDNKNLPDFFDYNLWYSSNDRNAPWTLPSGYHSNAVTSNNAVTYNSNNQTCTVSDDYPGRTSGRNGDCIGGFTYSESGVGVVLEAPQNFSNPVVAEAHFTWQANPSSENILGYRIYYGTTQGAYPNQVECGNVTDYKVTDLVENVTYYLVVRAYNQYGESPDSNEEICIITSSVGSVISKTFGETSDADYKGVVQDTFINLNTDVGIASQTLNIYTWQANQPANAIIMKLALSAIPANALIESATLHLYMSAFGGDDQYDISVHNIINHNPDLSQCTGFTYDGTNNWTSNNQCYNNIPLAQADIADAEDQKPVNTTIGYKTWNVTDMVRNWVDVPDTNYGLLVNSDSSASSNSYRTFASSEAANADQRPKLVITYISIGGTPPGIVSINAGASASGGNGLISFSIDGLEPADGRTYSWDFGDGGISSDQNPIHQYSVTSEGPNYTVILVVTESNSATRDATKTIDFPQSTGVEIKNQ